MGVLWEERAMETNVLLWMVKSAVKDNCWRRKTIHSSHRTQSTSFFIRVDFNTLYFKDSFWSVIYEKICEVLKSDLSARDVASNPMVLDETARPSPFPYSFFDFSANMAMHSETHADYVLALTHGVWHHASIGQLTSMPQWVTHPFVFIFRGGVWWGRDHGISDIMPYKCSILLLIC